MDAHASYGPILKGKSGAQEEVNLHIVSVDSRCLHSNIFLIDCPIS